MTSINQICKEMVIELIRSETDIKRMEILLKLLDKIIWDSFPEFDEDIELERIIL